MKSKRMRPGQPYEPGDEIGGRVITSIRFLDRVLDRTQYYFDWANCDHSGVVGHKTLNRAEIKGQNTECPACLRGSLKKPSPKKKEVAPAPVKQSAELELHMQALFLFGQAYASRK